MTEERLSNVLNYGKWISYQIIAVVVIYLLFMFIINRTTSAKFTKWDITTTTICDYSLKYSIPREIYTNFIKNIYQELEDTRGVPYWDDSVGYAFKRYLRSEFESILQERDEEISGEF